MTEIMTAAEAAANWWADAIGSPRFDNGDTSEIGGLTSMMAFLVAEGSPVDETKQKNFAEVLTSKIDQALEQASRYGGSVTLGVDYGPDRILGESADAAGVGHSRFPWKTNMHIYEHYIIVSAGYAADLKLVWATDEWYANRPVCGNQKWDSTNREENYNGDPWQCSLLKFHSEPCKYDDPVDLCAECGRKDGWYHNGDERGHMPDFHEFETSIKEEPNV